MKLLEITKFCTKAVTDTKKRRGRGTGKAEQSRRNCRAILLWQPPPTRTMTKQGKMPLVSPMASLDSNSAEFCTQVTNRMVVRL